MDVHFYIEQPLICKGMLNGFIHSRNSMRHKEPHVHNSLLHNQHAVAVKLNSTKLWTCIQLSWITSSGTGCMDSRIL